VPLINIEFVVPSGPLTQFVSMFYRFETDGADNGDHERADIAHCRFHFDSKAFVRFGDGREVLQPQSSVIGVRNRASYIYSIGAGWMFGFGLMPAGWLALTGKSSATAAENVHAAESLLGDIAPDIRSAVSGLTNLDDMAAAAAAILEPVCVQAADIPHWFVKAVDAWLASGLQSEFEDLVTVTGLSHRKTETLVRDLYGASPKLFIRKCRALRVANRIAHGEGDWQDYVGDAFYDQSHCIREIKYFTGITPAAIRDARTSMTHIQFQRRRELTAEKA
jgi:AraC-like DNA-binding protein